MFIWLYDLISDFHLNAYNFLMLKILYSALFISSYHINLKNLTEANALMYTTLFKFVAYRKHLQVLVDTYTFLDVKLVAKLLGTLSRTLVSRFIKRSNFHDEITRHWQLKG